MHIFRIFRACFIGLFLCLAVSVYAQPVDTLALRAKADSLNQAATACYQGGDPETAVESFLEAIRIRETVLGERSAGYVSSLNGLGACYLYLGEYDKALSTFRNSLGIAQEVLGESHPIYAKCISNIGLCHLLLGDTDKALECIAEAAAINRQALGEHHVEYANSLNNLGNCYQNLGDYDKALRYYSDASVIYRDNLGENSIQVAGTLNNIGNCYEELGDFGKAIEALSQAKEVYREILGEQHAYYSGSLINLGRCYGALGDRQTAIRYYTEAADLDRATLGEKHPQYAISLESIANNYFYLGEYDKALAYYEDVLTIYGESLGEQHPYYANTLNGIGLCYSALGDNEKTYDYYKKALDICEQVQGRQHPDYALIINNLGEYYHAIGDFGEAVACCKEALTIYRTVYGERNPDCARSLNDLGIIYSVMGDRDSTSAYFRSYASLISGLVLDAFTYLPQNKRSLYWDMYSRSFTDLLPAQARFLSDDKPFLCTAYDGALFSKGLLLNAETELRRLILESGDEAALALYDQLQEERLELDALYEMPVDERPMPADSLETVCETLERELQQKSKAFGDYTKNLSVTWKDVQAALGKRDIAIEFLVVPVSKDTTLYCALTLKPGYDAPHFVELFDLKELESLKAKYADRRNSDGLIYGDKALYDLVWKPLEKELQGVKNIYFGPSGELYQTAIEYADNGKGPLANQKNVYRLSSTRQLAVNHSEAQRSRSAVFGGLKYGASEAVLLADSRKYTQRSLPEDVFFSVDSLDIRGAGGGMMVSDLPGTESEALAIDALLRNMGLDNTLRMGEAGTEAAFKDLSGRQENIIHIATHGFYWNGRQAGQIGSRLGRTLEGEGAGRMQEDASMTRSGLLFAGANNALRGNREKKEGVDDGILTAKEIAQLDLRGTDLLVLSACQTGLGEVSGEGVFGLQRGFKKAGVNTILMSLWQVDDEATSLLMTSFYKELAKGRSKSAALKAAQKAVRNNKGKDFSSPYYWAAFILLDGE